MERPKWLKPYGDGDNFHDVLGDDRGNACVFFPTSQPGAVTVDARLTPPELRELADWVEAETTRLTSPAPLK